MGGKLCNSCVPDNIDNTHKHAAHTRTRLHTNTAHSHGGREDATTAWISPAMSSCHKLFCEKLE